MLLDDIRQIPSDRKTLRRFGLTMGVACLILGGGIGWRGGVAYPYVLGVGGGFLALGWLAPAVLWPIQKAWMTLGLLLGWVMTRLILTLLLYGVMTPMGLLSRLFGKDVLDRKFDRAPRSYWIVKSFRVREKREYENQF